MSTVKKTTAQIRNEPFFKVSSIFSTPFYVEEDIFFRAKKLRTFCRNFFSFWSKLFRRLLLSRVAVEAKTFFSLLLLLSQSDCRERLVWSSSKASQAFTRISGNVGNERTEMCSSQMDDVTFWRKRKKKKREERKKEELRRRLCSLAETATSKFSFFFFYF